MPATTIFNHLLERWRAATSPSPDDPTLVLRAGPGAAARWRALGKQGLFIVGHARSGTTVLQNALNDADDIYLFGEANFHRDPGSPDFRARYDHWHDQIGNQPAKSTRCPVAFDGDATWSDYLFHLSQFHRYVGEKLVINPVDKRVQGQDLMDFLATRFRQGHVIFCFRNPIDTLMSTQGLKVYQGFPIADYAEVVVSYLSVMRLYLAMLRLFPHVHAVFLEDPSEACFASIGRALGVDLSRVRSYYRDDNVRRHSLEELPEECRATVSALDGLYKQFRENAVAGFALPQLEQNRNNPSPAHPTPLGALYNQTERMLEESDRLKVAYGLVSIGSGVIMARFGYCRW